MKTKTHIKLSAMIIAGMLCAQVIQAQTYGSSNVGNSCGTLAGTAGTRNTFLGCGSGNNITSGNSNTALGHMSLKGITSGDNNTVIGDSAGYSTNTGAVNVFVGIKAGKQNTSGFQNTFIGVSAGASNITNGYCTFVGNGAGIGSIADRNTFVGFYSGGLNTTGTGNVCMGDQCGYNNVAGTNNTLLGFQCGVAGLTYVGYDYSNNTFLGYQSGFGTTTGSNNVFLGFKSGYSNTVGTPNTFIGYEAGYNNTKTGENVAVGYQALKTQTYSGATIGTYNVAIGNQALFTNNPTTTTNGYYNVALGYRSGYLNTNGQKNVFVGANAGYNCTDDWNTFIGNNSGGGTTSGNLNFFGGYISGYSNTSGSDNVYLGYNAGYANTTTSNNTAVGALAGDGNATCSNSTFLGYNADASGNYSNCMALGNGASTDSTNHIFVGNSSINKAWVKVNWTIGSDRRIKNNIQENVHGLDFIKLLRPVTFHYDVDKENQLMGINQVTNATDSTAASPVEKGKYDIQQTAFTGLIAQEVDSAAQQVGFNFSGVDKSSKVMGLRYAEFTVPLIKAVQELSRVVDSLLAVKSGQRTNNNSDSTQGKVETSLQVELANNNNAILYQNEPNPFDGSTIIRYFIPENVTGSVSVLFCDLYGKEIKNLEITERGFGKIEADTENLASGIYSYSIVVDGKTIDTKKMLKSK